MQLAWNVSLTSPHFGQKFIPWIPQVGYPGGPRNVPRKMPGSSIWPWARAGNRPPRFGVLAESRGWRATSTCSGSRRKVMGDIIMSSQPGIYIYIYGDEMDESSSQLYKVYGCPWRIQHDKIIVKMNGFIWVNYNDLTATSLEIIVSKGNHPQMALIQVSELL